MIWLLIASGDNDGLWTAGKDHCLLPRSRNGTVDGFLYLHCIAWREPVLDGREPAERLGYAARAEPAQPGTELGHELAGPGPF